MLYELCAGEKPIDEALMKKIITFKDSWDQNTKRMYEPIPDAYSEELSDIIDFMLNSREDERPTMSEVMNTKILWLKMKELFPDMKPGDRPQSKGALDID